VGSHLSCGGTFSDDFIANLLVSLLVKEIWKSVNIWYSNKHKKPSCS